ncbi:MAG: hypothetical protein R3E97_12545 [Candidatus Eisenbacteria bacterium]
MIRQRLQVSGLLFCLCLCVGLVGPGCDDDSVSPDPIVSPYLPATSAANLLDNLITAMEARNSSEYEKLFDEEEFKFRFDPVDLEGENNNLPEFWGFDGEAQWSRNAFESTDVLRISLEFDKGPLQDVAPEDGEFVDLSWKKMMVTSVHLEIEMKNPADPTDNVIFLVQGDRAQFFFAIDEEHTIGGEPTWKIVEWRDIRIEGRPSLVEEKSFGGIKSIFL